MSTTPRARTFVTALQLQSAVLDMGNRHLRSRDIWIAEGDRKMFRACDRQYKAQIRLLWALTNLTRHA